jgi:cytoskeletal protein RodZ
MTTRDQARRATDVRAEVDRSGVTAEPAPGLPERLYTARERKGVDLYRAERDTKIRARYLEALERGEWKALPGAVYTKGFLRNYALYLGLDPEDVLRQWRRERGDIREVEPIAVPRPIAAPRQGLNFSPGIVWAALLTLGVIAFIAYLGMQLLRFAKPPTLEVTHPATALVDVDEGTASYVLRGTSIAGASISISTPGREQPYRINAGADGSWTAEVDLRRGRNQFTIGATDPETGKQAETPVDVFITVPFEQIQAPTLTVEQPAEGATFENGAIPVQGTTTDASEVVVAAEFLGPADNQPAPPAATNAPAGSPGASPSPPAGPHPPTVTVEVGEDGVFSTPYQLTAGRWKLTVTASGEEGKKVSLTRNVTVAFKGVNLTVEIKGGSAWVKVWVDGAVDPTVGAAGRTYRDGRTLTFMGERSVEVRTGSSGVTHFTLNGTSLGALGRSGIPETWLFEPPDPPRQTGRT